MSEPYVQAGYDYPAAILELRNRFTYDEIAQYCGYESSKSIGWILRGKEPKHRSGEALYILFVETFGRKPPQHIKRQFIAPLMSISTA